MTHKNASDMLSMLKSLAPTIIVCPFCKNAQDYIGPDHNFCVCCGSNLKEPKCPNCEHHLSINADPPKTATEKKETNDNRVS